MSKIFESLFGSKEVRILILGLDNAGKTTILYRVQNESDEVGATIPTIGFNVETLQYKNIKVCVGSLASGMVSFLFRQRTGSRFIDLNFQSLTLFFVIVPSMGSGWPNKYSPLLAMLLSQH